MALTQPISPSRQPFGVLDSSRLRFLGSVKNQQNAVTASLKRRLDTTDLSDTENVDPSSTLDSPAKRTRNNTDEDVSKSSSSSKFTLTPFKPSTTTININTTKRLQTPLTQLKKPSLPNSAPLRAPAGRSPKSKSKPIKAFSRRSIGSYTRIDPPTFTSTKQHHAARAPFSIADALHGTFNTPQSQSNSRSVMLQEKARPKAWDFEIYVDTEQDEMANLMEHSTCVLDISDDETRGKRWEVDDRGKENIPPPEFEGRGGEGMQDTTVPVPVAVAVGGRVSVEMTMTDQPRSALGELDISHFIAGNENENDNENENVSNIKPSTTIPTITAPEGHQYQLQLPEQEQQQEQEQDHEQSPESIPLPADNDNDYDDLTHPPPQQEATPSQPKLASHAAISALITRSAPAPAVHDDSSSTQTQTGMGMGMVMPTAAEVEIWESGSAAGADAAAGDDEV
ncbi:hypothetical protein FQN53_004839 [Emmonsiellopsis sp. PD_33]|nr:hypothetical protein FQN53_004839 [Emmonsiellopsis sp. PD_33]